MNIGIIGFGVMGKTRFKAIKAINENHRVTKICDTSSPQNGDFHGVDYTTDYNKILNDPNIDVVFVCTPNYLSKTIVIAALRMGKHVFCEKPPGMNSSETIEMIGAEKINPGLKLMFGFNHRHHDSMIFAKQVIDSGEYGEILWLRGRYGKNVDEEFSHTWRAKKSLAGGGIFLDQGIHMLDLFLMMCGDFDETLAYVSNLFWRLDVEDNVFAMFRNKKGQVASLHSTMTQWRHLFSLEIFLSKGHIVINGLLTNSGAYGREELTMGINNSVKPSVSWDNEEKRIYNINNSWENEVQIFFDSIENNRNIPVGNTKDALKLMTLVDKVYTCDQYSLQTTNNSITDPTNNPFVMPEKKSQVFHDSSF